MSVLSRSWLYQGVRWTIPYQEAEARNLVRDLEVSVRHETPWHRRQLAIWQEREDARLIAGVAWA